MVAIGQKDWAPKPEAHPFASCVLPKSAQRQRRNSCCRGRDRKGLWGCQNNRGLFRYRNKIGLSVAIEGLQEALRQRKATPGEIGRQAERGGVATVIRPRR